jgi:hypothetical protein
MKGFRNACAPRRRAGNPVYLAIALVGCLVQLSIATDAAAANTWSSLTVDYRVYSDRNHRFTWIPPKYVGIPHLLTADNDKYVSSSSAVRFWLGRGSNVYVGYDRRTATLPTWLQSWNPTADTLWASNGGFKVYRRWFAKGWVTLGGNEMGNNMYIVAIDNQSGGSSQLSISGTPPASAPIGQSYWFKPNVSGGSGNVRFSIRNKPAWAKFTADTGGLWGIPGAGDVGSYGNIRITATDGGSTVSLPTFAISVAGGSTNSATLSWNAPSQNTDGTPLIDLAGYKVYWGTSSGKYGNSRRIDNAGVTTYVVDGLGTGTYYFVVTALSRSGEESRFSNEASKRF